MTSLQAISLKSGIPARETRTALNNLRRHLRKGGGLFFKGLWLRGEFDYSNKMSNGNHPIVFCVGDETFTWIEFVSALTRAEDSDLTNLLQKFEK